MLKNKLKFSLIVFSLIIFLFSFTYATENQEILSVQGDTTSEPTNETSEEVTTTNEQSDTNAINTDYYKTTTSLTIEATEVIDGNAYIMAEELTIKGKIVGDAFIMANTVTIDGGYIYNNAYILANNLKITGESLVYHLYALCNEFNLDETGIIYRDLRVAANTVNLSGCVGRDAFVNSSNFTLNANSYGKTVFGNLNYSSKSAIVIPEGAVAGDITFNELKTNEGGKINFTSYLQSLCSALLYTAVIVLLIILFIPTFIEKTHQLLTKKLLPTIGIGALALIGIPIICFILLFTIIGVPLSASLTTIFILLICISMAVVSLSLSNLVVNKFNLNKFINIPIALGFTLVIWALKLIPFVNIAVGIALPIFGLGLIFSNLLLKKKLEVTE